NGFEPEKEARQFLAQEARQSGDSALALEQGKALTAVPDADKEDFENYISLLLSANQTSDAYVVSKTGISKWPNDALLQELLGHAAAATDHKEEAKAAYQEALKIDPSRSGARAGLSKL